MARLREDIGQRLGWAGAGARALVATEAGVLGTPAFPNQRARAERAVEPIKSEDITADFPDLNPPVHRLCLGCRDAAWERTRSVNYATSWTSMRDTLHGYGLSLENLVELTAFAKEPRAHEAIRKMIADYLPGDDHPGALNYRCPGPLARETPNLRSRALRSRRYMRRRPIRTVRVPPPLQCPPCFGNSDLSSRPDSSLNKSCAEKQVQNSGPQHFESGLSSNMFPGDAMYGCEEEGLKGVPPIRLAVAREVPYRAAFPFRLRGCT